MTMKNDPEKVLVLGDSHGDASYMAAAIDLAAKNGAGVVHVVGDFGIWTHIQAGVDFLDRVDDMARADDVVVTFTDGNHENFDHLYDIPVDGDGWRRVRERIWHAPRGHIWRWNNVNFLSMGGAHSIDGPGGVWGPDRGPIAKDIYRVVQTEDGPRPVLLPAGFDLGGWWPQEVITDDEVQTAIQNMVEWADEFNPYPNIDVMFTHDAPAAVTLPPRFQGYPAADENRKRLQQVYEVAQPQLLVHGHYHAHSQYHDRNLDCLAVGLASNNDNGGQYMFIRTDQFEITVPQWGNR